MGIAIVDYGRGNRRSVVKAFEKVGADVALTGDHDALRAADGLVVPGVGAFPEAMRRLRASGLDEVVVERAEAGVPVIGLCLGMQLLFETSTEHEGATGLGLLGGEVALIEAHRLAVADVDCGIEDQSVGTPEQIRTKLPSSCRPCVDDFSGWHCAPKMWPRSTKDTNGEPYSPVPSTTSSSAGSGA